MSPQSMSLGTGAAHGAIVPIAKQTITPATSGAGFSFTNIPQGYQDLMVISTHRSTYDNNQFGTYLLLNGSSFSSGYGWSRMLASGVGTSFEAYGTQGDINLGNMPANYNNTGSFGQTTIHIMNYASTTMFKSVFSRTGNDMNNNLGFAMMGGGTLRSTNAITAVSLGSAGYGYLAPGSTATLYGVRTIGQ